MKIESVGVPNLQRFAEVWVSLIAAREGVKVEPGSVKVELKPGESRNGSE